MDDPTYVKNKVHLLCKIFEKLSSYENIPKRMSGFFLKTKRKKEL